VLVPGGRFYPAASDRVVLSTGCSVSCNLSLVNPLLRAFCHGFDRLSARKCQKESPVQSGEFRTIPCAISLGNTKEIHSALLAYPSRE
jgi:hypothetical protein